MTLLLLLDFALTKHDLKSLHIVGLVDNADLLSPCTNDEEAEMWELFRRALQSLEYDHQLLGMFDENFHQALIALLANYLQLRKRLGVPVLKIALENLLKGLCLVPTGI